jgi:hypothetical protein
MSEIEKYYTKPSLAKRYDKSPRSIDRWRAAGKFPQPDMYLPNGQPVWSDTIIEQHERAAVAAMQSSASNTRTHPGHWV